MYFFYLHAGGNASPHAAPLAAGQSPVFTLSAIALHERTWRQLHAGYIALKQSVFSDEIREAQPEGFVVSGEDVIGASGSGTEHGDFLRNTLRLCESLDVVAASASFIKSARFPYDPVELYRLALQHLAERLQHFLATRPEPHQGVLVFDAASAPAAEVAQAHVDALLGTEASRLIEAPLLAVPELSMGVQVASLVGSAIYANTVYRYCRDIPGVPDYEPMTAFWPYLDRLQFRGPPMPGAAGITYGYRTEREPDSPPST